MKKLLSLHAMTDLRTYKKEYEAQTRSKDKRKTDSVGQVEWDTDIVREARKAVQRGEEGERPCQKGTCRVRATAMEGSFGTQKEHYDLRRFKARTKLTEILYIFFGIHSVN